MRMLKNATITKPPESGLFGSKVMSPSESLSHVTACPPDFILGNAVLKLDDDFLLAHFEQCARCAGKFIALLRDLRK